MKSWKLILQTLLILGLAAGLSGCQNLFGSSGPSGIDPSTDDYYDESYFEDLSMDLEDENGGYAATDEEPFFGDNSFSALIEEDEPVGDEMAEDADVLDMEDDVAAETYYVRLLWGQLEGNAESTIPTNWAGSITVDRGAIVAVRQIRFEHLTDWVVRPREDPLLLELFSTTTVHNDGLLLKIIDPTPDADEPNNLVIDLGPGQATVPVVELDDYEELITVDDLGNQLAINALRKFDCPNGFLGGIWVRRHEDRGIMRGIWTSFEGEILGVVRGHWGVREDGSRVLFGKYIGVDGQFRGFVRGHWGLNPDDPSPNGGLFWGNWLDQSHSKIGDIWGRYRKNYRRGGFFGGRWLEECGL